jgi:hypothetical protein
MPNYLDILQQFKDRNRVSQTYNPINPYSSAGYTGFDAGESYDIAKQEALAETDIIPEDVYTKPSTLEKGISVYQGISQAGKITGNKSIFGAKGLLGGLDTRLGQSAAYTKAMGAPYTPAIAPVAAVPPTEAIGAIGEAGYKAATLGTEAVAGVPASHVAATSLPGSGLSAGQSGVLGSIAYALANDKNPYTYKTGEAVGMGIGDYMSATSVMSAMPALSAAAPWLPIAAAGLGYLLRSGKSKKMAKKQSQYQRGIERRYTENIGEARERFNAESLARRQETGNTLYGGYAQAAQGMKYAKYKYNTGGNLKGDVIAEFTGNELVVNNQSVVEQGLKEKNYSKAAAPIREAIRGGRITPGIETHKNNPMPVDKSGMIYAGGGPLSFRVQHGAGIYDHASEQFKSTMSDKAIALTAQKNINKWKSNNMYA